MFLHEAGYGSNNLLVEEGSSELHYDVVLLTLSPPGEWRLSQALMVKRLGSRLDIKIMTDGISLLRLLQKPMVWLTKQSTKIMEKKHYTRGPNASRFECSIKVQ